MLARLLIIALLTAPAFAQSTGEFLQNIRSAATPSDAVAAYAKAVASLGDDANAEFAFVVRMVDFGHPEMAESQASDLTHRLDEGLPWAVLAHMSAQRQQIDTAVTQIATAVKQSPNDQFVTRTAAIIVAEYDRQQQSADTTKQTIESLRKNLGGRSSFVRAYEDARAANEPAPAEAAAPTTMPAYNPRHIVVVGSMSGLAYPAPPTYLPYPRTYIASPHVRSGYFSSYVYPVAVYPVAPIYCDPGPILPVTIDRGTRVYFSSRVHYPRR